MPDDQKKKNQPEDLQLELYDSFDDREFYEAMEVEEVFKEGRISEDEHRKLVYISKTRELLKGGDA